MSQDGSSVLGRTESVPGRVSRPETVASVLGRCERPGTAGGVAQDGENVLQTVRGASWDGEVQRPGTA